MLNPEANKVNILYECNCGEKVGAEDTYYCKSCGKFYCNNCTFEEIIQYYCPVSFDTFGLSEINQIQGKSQKHFECPRCSSQLSPMVENQNETISSYSLKCNYCNWTTKEIGIETENIKSLINIIIQNEKEQKITVENQKQLKQLINYYNKKINPTKNLFKYSSPRNSPLNSPLKMVSSPYKSNYLYHPISNQSLSTQFSSVLSNNPKERVTVSELENELEKREKEVIIRSKNVDKDSIIDDEIEKKELFGNIDLNESINLERKLQEIPNQPKNEKDLFPKRIKLKSKKGRLCLSCGHPLIKPDLQQNVRFKIQNFGLLELPKITLLNYPIFKTKEKTEVFIVFTNLSSTSIQINSLKFSLESSLLENQNSPTNFIVQKFQESFFQSGSPSKQTIIEDLKSSNIAIYNNKVYIKEFITLQEEIKEKFLNLRLEFNIELEEGENKKEIKLKAIIHIQK
ncbi:dynactin p62 subunit [Anaeramoeba ignava]|uniref:Dynactin subunit 4 n=1 Tax=Anaeramoeba ignava TaxID=1746090 RepID=A0A9Q0LW52_ANAIG|nr:dynactin p62 subunit [Anaeramoeba ignava]